MDRKAVQKASFWSIGGLGAGQVLRLLSNLVLTRLLFPEAFGLMALIAVLMQGLTMLSDVGVYGNIIRSGRGEDQDFVNTAWTIQVLRGIGIFVCICLLARPFANFYDEQQFVALVPAVGLSALFAGFNSTALVVANRRLWLGRATVLTICAQLVSISVMVVWAWLAASVWALVAGNLAGSFLTAAVSHLIFPQWRNRLRWEWEAVREIIKIGKWIFLSSALTFLSAQLDRLVLGKLVPLGIVGVYSIGFMWAQVPLALAQSWTMRVFFPLASNAELGKPGKTTNVLRIRRRLNLVAAGCVAGLYGGLTHLFHFIYSSDYWGAVEIFEILLLGKWIRILEASYARINVAAGTPAYTTFGTALTIALFMTSCYPMYERWGVEGVAGAFAVSQLGVFFGSAYGASRHGKSDLRSDVYNSGVAALLGWIFSSLSASVFAA